VKKILTLALTFANKSISDEQQIDEAQLLLEIEQLKNANDFLVEKHIKQLE
jgi:hypothetical protein